MLGRGHAGQGRFAYTANAASGTLSVRIHPRGWMTLLDPNGDTESLGAASHPLDEAVTPGGSFLYVLADGLGSIEGLRDSGSERQPPPHRGAGWAAGAGTVGIAAR